jgi:cytochrome c-type biogenesis protein CcmF
MVAERRGTLRTWTHALVIATFVLTLVGTFLTRSGVVVSVHAFTTSGIGAWFAAAILITLGVALGLLLWRLPELGDRRPPGAVISRESAFLFNNVLFLGITFAVLFGTLYPVIVEVTSGSRATVGAPWFNLVNAPIFVALLFLTGVGPALPWGGASWATVRERFAVPILAAVGVVVAAWAVAVRGVAPLAILGLATFVLVVMGDEVVRGARARSRGRNESLPLAVVRLATRNRRRYGGYLAHAGICVMSVAIAVSATLGSDKVATLHPGETLTMGAYTLTYDQLVIEPLAADPRVIETRAELTLAGPQSGPVVTALRDYPNSSTAIATPAVRSALGEDLYVTLLSYNSATKTVSLHVLINPLVSWIWAGGGIVALGALFAIWPDRRRLVLEAALAAGA